MRSILCVLIFLVTLVPVPEASAEGSWRNCEASKSFSFARMWFFRNTNLGHVMNPERVTRCEYRKLKEWTMYGFVLERSVPGDRLGREFLTSVLGVVAGEHGYRVEGRPFLSSGTKVLSMSSPYVHEIIPEDPENRRFTFVTGTFVALSKGPQRLTLGFYGAHLTEEEIADAFEDVLLHLSL